VLEEHEQEGAAVSLPAVETSGSSTARGWRQGSLQLQAASGAVTAPLACSTGSQLQASQTEIAAWLRDKYAITDRRRVLVPLRRAVAALTAAEAGMEGVQQLSLEDHIKPRIEVNCQGVGVKGCDIVPGGWRAASQHTQKRRGGCCFLLLCSCPLCSLCSFWTIWGRGSDRRCLHATQRS
jgi:hypothetical protein